MKFLIEENNHPINMQDYYKTYIDTFAGHSYLIEAKFGELDYSVSDVITVISYNEDETNAIVGG